MDWNILNQRLKFYLALDFNGLDHRTVIFPKVLYWQVINVQASHFTLVEHISKVLCALERFILVMVASTFLMEVERTLFFNTRSYVLLKEARIKIKNETDS
jgi:hypothetical protein